RRRHTRSDRDWSSDVCSSDLFHMHFLHYFCLRQREFKHAVLQDGLDLFRTNLDRELHRAIDLVELLFVNGPFLLLFFELLLARDDKPPGLHVDVQLLLGEAGDFGANDERYLGLIEFQVDRAEHLRLRLEEALQVAGEEPRCGAEQFAPTTRDEVKKILHRRGKLLELLEGRREWLHGPLND